MKRRYGLVVVLLVIALGAAHRIQTEFNPEWLIVETTGLAYPNLIKENLQLGIGMDSRICILVDASRWNRLLRPMNTLFSGQIIGSDAVLINKADLVEEAEIGRAHV